MMGHLISYLKKGKNYFVTYLSVNFHVEHPKDQLLPSASQQWECVNRLLNLLSSVESIFYLWWLFLPL